MTELAVQLHASEALRKREGRLNEIELLKHENAVEEHDLMAFLFNNDGRGYLKVDWARIAKESR